MMRISASSVCWTMRLVRALPQRSPARADHNQEQQSPSAANTYGVSNRVGRTVS